MLFHSVFHIIRHPTWVMMCAMSLILQQWFFSLRQFGLMSLLLSSPARLPWNPYCLLLTLFAYAAIGLLLADRQGYSTIALQMLLEVTLLGTISWLGLKWKNTPERFLQTFSALVGVNLVISLVSIPWQRALDIGEGEPTRAAVLVFFGLLIWNLAAISMIFKRAFEISTQLSAVLSFNYFLVFYFVLVGLFR